jgi:hypothetical protein
LSALWTGRTKQAAPYALSLDARREAGAIAAARKRKPLDVLDQVLKAVSGSSTMCESGVNPS